MDLDNRENYLKERRLLNRLPLPQLEKMVGELHDLRYNQNDISVDAYHRLAANVLLTRTNDGKSLIFHLKNYLGIVLVICGSFTTFKL